MQHIFPSLEDHHHFIQQTTYLFLKGSRYNPNFSIFQCEGFSRFPFKKLLKISIFTHKNQDKKTRFSYPLCIKIKKSTQLIQQDNLSMRLLFSRKLTWPLALSTHRLILPLCACNMCFLLHNYFYFNPHSLCLKQEWIFNIIWTLFSCLLRKEPLFCFQENPHRILHLQAWSMHSFSKNKL